MRRRRVNMQLAELAAEGQMLLRRDVLVAKEDHEVFGERAVNLVHLTIGAPVPGDQPADVDARNLGADDRGELFNGDGLVGLGFIGELPVARSLLAGQRAHAHPPTSETRSFLPGSCLGLDPWPRVLAYSAAVTVAAGFLAPAP